MTESKDFRSGTRTLLWEKDKLAMEYQDLQMKWTEIQQTKVQTVFFYSDFLFKAYTVQTRNQMSHARHTNLQGMFINSIHVHTFVDYL